MNMREDEELELEVADEVAEENGRRMLEEAERAGTLSPATLLRQRLARASRSRLPEA